MTDKKPLNGKANSKAAEVGLVQWFHLDQYEEVKQILIDIEKLGITHLRTNISWANWHRQQPVHIVTSTNTTLNSQYCLI